MIPLSKILKDSKSIVIRRVKKRSYPLEEDTITVGKKITLEEELTIKKERLKARNSGNEIEDPVVIRKKIKK